MVIRKNLDINKPVTECAEKSVFFHLPGDPDQEKLISLCVLSVSNDPEQRRREVGGEDIKCKQFNAPRSSCS